MAIISPPSRCKRYVLIPRKVQYGTIHLMFFALLICMGVPCNPAGADDGYEWKNPRVEYSLSSLLELIRDPEKRSTIKRSQEDWIRSKKNLCKSIVDSNHAELNKKRIKECIDASDRTRIDFLNHQRMELLLDAYPQQVSRSAARISYSPETQHHPSRPRALVIAAAAPVAAVTFDEMTEIFDLSSGQLVSRIETLDADKRSGQFDYYLSPNGRILMASYMWPKTGLKIWDVRKGDLLFDSKTSPHIHRYLMSQGKQFIYTEGRGKIGIYDIARDEASWNAKSESQTSNVALSADDRWLCVVRPKDVEIWELSMTNNRMSFVLRNSMPYGAYADLYQWIVFSRDNRSIYGSIPSTGTLVEWRLPDLKMVRRLRFSGYQSVKLARTMRSDLFLMEAFTRNNKMDAFVVDMANQTAARIYDHSGADSKMVSLANGTILIASPYLLKTVNIPESKELLPFKQVFGVVDEAESSGLVQPRPPHVRDKRQENCGGFQTEAVSVYEGTLPAGVKHSYGSHPPGTVKVNIGKTDLPVKLVLSSYEPVIWQLKMSPDARLLEVFLSGSSESRVEGQQIKQVTFIGNYHGYNKKHTGQLEDMVNKYTGCTVSRIQKSYKGNSFSIGEVSASGNNRIIRYVDERGNVTYRDY